LEGITDDTVTVYRHGNFVDLCRGPHLESTGRAKAYKLLSIAGAYWHGDEKQKMLQRIYGISYETKEELDAHLYKIEEAQKGIIANSAESLIFSVFTNSRQDQV